MSTPTDWLERQFDLRARGSTVGREVRGAVATFVVIQVASLRLWAVHPALYVAAFAVFFVWGSL
jgi:hypothetical protein